MSMKKDRAPETYCYLGVHETSSITSHANRSVYHNRGAPARTTSTYLLYRCHPIIVAGKLGKHAPMRKQINNGDANAGGADVTIHPGITNEGTIVLNARRKASQSANDRHGIVCVILSNHVMV